MSNTQMRPPALDLGDTTILHVRRMQVATMQGDARAALAAYYDARRTLDEVQRALYATIPATPEAKR